MPDLLDHAAADYLRALAPRDLPAGVPVYVVNQSALPPDRGGDLTTAGITGPTLDVQLRDLIGPAWAGRGVCMVLNDAYARARFGDWPPGVESYFRSVAVHELAHCLTRRRLYHGTGREACGNLAAYAARDAAGLSADPDHYAARLAEVRAAPVVHGPRFTRVALHAWWRAGGWGSGLQPRVINGGYDRVKYAGSKQFIAALGDELDRLRDASFAEVRRLALPPAFLALWKHDAGLAPDDDLADADA